MSKSKRDLTPEERALWRRVASTTKPRSKAPAAAEPVAHSKPSRKSPVQTAAPRVAAPNHPPPQNRIGEKRVRRGKIEIGATLDLHGHTQDSALAALSRFLRRAHARGDRTVIVVTGVGRGGEGVLKRMLPSWLTAGEIRPMVSGYAPAHRSHGGAGAFYVFIRSQRQ